MAADIVDKPTRSRMMAGIRGTNSKPELFVRSALHRRGFRFRIHDKRLPGKPDIVLPKYKVVVQIHGCFWHYHGCHLFKWPSTRAEWWKSKLEKTRDSDISTMATLLDNGWRVATVWECALKGKGQLGPNVVIDALVDWIEETDGPVSLVIEGRAIDSM